MVTTPKISDNKNRILNLGEIFREFWKHDPHLQKFNSDREILKWTVTYLLITNTSTLFERKKKSYFIYYDSTLVKWTYICFMVVRSGMRIIISLYVHYTLFQCDNSTEEYV